MAASDRTVHAQLRSLGPLLCWAIVYADIGTSIYYTPGILARDVGTSAATYVLATSLAFVLLAEKYAEIAARYPGGGGVVSVAEEAFGPRIGALGGMLILVDYFLTAAISAVSGFTYLASLVPGLAGLEWANEISEAMLYLVTLLCAPWLMRQGQHIRVDIILRAVPKPVGWAFEWIVDVLALGCCAAMAYYGARAALASYSAGSMSIKTRYRAPRGISRSPGTK